MKSVIIIMPSCDLPAGEAQLLRTHSKSQREIIANAINEIEYGQKEKQEKKKA